MDVIFVINPGQPQLENKQKQELQMFHRIGLKRQENIWLNKLRLISQYDQRLINIKNIKLKGKLQWE